MRATLDILDRFGDGLLILATVVQGLLDLLWLRLRLRLRLGLGDRLLADLRVNKNPLGKTVIPSSLVLGLPELLFFCVGTHRMTHQHHTTSHMWAGSGEVCGDDLSTRGRHFCLPRPPEMGKNAPYLPSELEFTIHECLNLYFQSPWVSSFDSWGSFTKREPEALKVRAGVSIQVRCWSFLKLSLEY